MHGGATQAAANLAGHLRRAFRLRPGPDADAMGPDADTIGPDADTMGPDADTGPPRGPWAVVTRSRNRSRRRAARVPAGRARTRPPALAHLERPPGAAPKLGAVPPRRDGLGRKGTLGGICLGMRQPAGSSLAVRGPAAIRPPASRGDGRESGAIRRPRWKWVSEGLREQSDWRIRPSKRTRAHSKRAGGP